MFRMKEESKFVKLLLYTFIFIFFCLCLTSFFMHQEKTLLGNFTDFDNDDVKYLRSAWTLLETGKYTYRYPNMDTIFIMPGFTTVLAGFVSVFGKYPIHPFRIFQALLGCFSLFILFLIARKLFHNKIALLCVLLSVIYFPNIYVTHLILTEQIFATLFLLFFLVCLYGIETKSTKLYIFGGILLGLMTLFRPAIILFPIVVFIMWLIQKYNWKEILKFSIMVIAIVTVILSPWMIRNAVLFQKFIPLTIASGNPFLQGTYINYNEAVAESENVDYDALIRQKGELDLELYGKDEIVTDKIESWIGKYRIKNFMTKEPLKYLEWYTVGKTIKNFESPFLWYPIFDIDPTYSFYKVQHRTFLALFFLGLLLLIIKKKVKGIMWLPLLSVLYFNISHLPFFCFPRYMFPIMFIVILFSAYFIYTVIKWVVSLLSQIKLF